MTELLCKEEVYAIVGAAMDVHREEGHGFAEPVYQECMEIELADRRVPAEAQKEMTIVYKGRRLKKSYIADFVAFGKVIVELKALDRLTSREESQVINYLKASGMEVGVLINFGAPSLEWERIVLTGQAPKGTIAPVDLQAKAKNNSRQLA
jgi:GxxExxY protein